MNTNNTSKTQEGLAQGMTNIYDEVNTSVASAIKQDLLAHFGKGLYYHLKNGEKPINPEQQAFIAATFVKHGVHRRKFMTGIRKSSFVYQMMH